LNCATLSKNTNNPLASECNKFFTSCFQAERISECEKITMNLEILMDHHSKNEFKGDFEGPLNRNEIEDFSNQRFKDQLKKGDSFWWYIQGDEKSGAQGVVAIENCQVVANQLYSAWILDDIAMLN
tara:strand:+ start:19307 stop:19684 length:378 start_codon:yes stop_codon:yes gene_type:complete